MGEDRALRGAGRPAGVLEQRDVARARLRLGVREERARATSGSQRGTPEGSGPLSSARVLRALGDREPERQPLPQGQRRDQAHREHRLQRGAVAQPEHRAGHLVPADRHPRAAVRELMGELVGRVERVVLDHHRAQPERGVERDHVLGTVRHHQRDAIPPLDSETLQGARRPGAPARRARRRSSPLRRSRARAGRRSGARSPRASGAGTRPGSRGPPGRRARRRPPTAGLGGAQVLRRIPGGSGSGAGSSTAPTGRSGSGEGSLAPCPGITPSPAVLICDSDRSAAEEAARTPIQI